MQTKEDAENWAAFYDAPAGDADLTGLQWQAAAAAARGLGAITGFAKPHGDDDTDDPAWSDAALLAEMRRAAT